MSITKAEAKALIQRRAALKDVRQDALRAFGFERDLTQTAPLLDPPRIVNERTLHMDRITDKLRTDIPGFLKRYFNFPNDEFVEKNGTVPHVVELLEEMFIGGKVLAMFATDHAKSWSADYFFPILSMAENPDESHILLGSNFPDMKRRVQVIQRELEGNHDLIRDFPWLKQPPTLKQGGKGGVAWSRIELTVSGRSANRPDPNVYACAIGSNDIRGRRGKLIMDDIEGVRNSRYALSRQELYDFVKLEATRCLEDRAESQRPLLIALGTPFDPDSIYLKLESEDWRVLKVPAYSVPYEKIEMSAHMKGTTTQTPWQERAALLPDRYFTWPRKRFKVTGADPRFGRGLTRSQFAIQYLLDPTEGKPGRMSILQMRDLVSQTETPQETDWQTFVSLDPASGSKTRFADYAGLSVVRLRWPRSEKFPDLQVLECQAVESGLWEQVALAADLCRDFQCPLIYESNAQQGGTYRDAFSHLRPEVKLVPFYTTHGAKFDEEMGLTVIRTLIRNDKLKVPARILDSEGVQSFLTEIRDLGTERHDHITCSVWFAVRWMFEQVRFYNGPALVPVVARSFGNSGTMNWRTWKR